MVVRIIFPNNFFLEGPVYPNNTSQKYIVDDDFFGQCQISDLDFRYYGKEIDKEYDDFIHEFYKFQPKR
jgi:hypothetical protein